MVTYKEIFNRRGDLYNKAGRMAPLARKKERDLILDLLELKSGHLVCDAPAGGGYVADGIDELMQGRCQVVCVEPSENFAEAINPKFMSFVAPLERIPLEDGSMDRVASLAGIHHLEEKQGFFKEVFRILKPGGIFAVSDVREGSQAGKFLNDVVDRFTDTGHQGFFLREAELTSLLTQSGFIDIKEHYHQFSWTCQNRDTLLKFCHQLFGLVKVNLEQVEHELKRYFDMEVTRDSAKLPWSLLYAVGTKPV